MIAMGANSLLTGMRVLDLSRALSGPFCALILADLGADVIKVEALPSGDMMRTWGPFQGSESAYYLSGNRNKRGIAVNFRSAAGRALLRKMAIESDVIVENFKPGTLSKIGLDPNDLRKANPRLIVASISGFGSDGPLSNRPGFDQIAQGHSGLMSITGAAETGPTRVGVAIGDLTSGMWLTIGILSAWIEKEKSGQGRLVETSLLASLVGLLSIQGQRFLSFGETPAPVGNMHPVISPYGVFRAKDGDLNIAAATQEMWLKLCDVLALPELKLDVRFSDNASRMQNRNLLCEIISGALASDTKKAWSDRLIEAGIPAGPINTLADVFEDEQVKHLGLIENFEHPALGTIRQVSNPLKFSNARDGWIRQAPPMLGQHTREVLKEFGIDEAQILEWEREGVVLQGTFRQELRGS